MKDPDYYLKLLADHIGDFEWWHDFATNSLKIRAGGGEIYTISAADIAFARDEYEVLQKIINLLAAKQIAASKEHVYETIKNEGSIRRDVIDRISEINAELDILRGRVPTPKGYNIDINRAKELMTELKELMK